MAKTERYLNFSFGITLFVFALLFMFTKEVFGLRHGHQLDSLFLGLLGVLSLWASISKFEWLAYLINVVLGTLVLVVTSTIAVFQLSRVEDFLTFRLDFTQADFIFHLAIGLVFIVNALYLRRGYQRSLYGYDTPGRPD